MEEVVKRRMRKQRGTRSLEVPYTNVVVVFPYSCPVQSTRGATIPWFPDQMALVVSIVARLTSGPRYVGTYCIALHGRGLEELTPPETSSPNVV
jgi:hypothetical protein